MRFIKKYTLTVKFFLTTYKSVIKHLYYYIYIIIYIMQLLNFIRLYVKEKRLNA